MDFGFTDDQRDIQAHGARRPARRARDVRCGCASTPRRGRPTTALWSELSELGWPGIAISEANGGQGLGHDRAFDPVRGDRTLARAGAVPAERDGGVA